MQKNDLSLPSPLTDCKKFNLTDALLSYRDLVQLYVTLD